MRNIFDNLKITIKKSLSKYFDSNFMSNTKSEYKNLTEEEVLKEAEKLKKLQGDNLELYIMKREFKEKYNILDKNVKIVLKHYFGEDMLMPEINNINLSNPFEFKKYRKNKKKKIVHLQEEKLTKNSI